MHVSHVKRRTPRRTRPIEECFAISHRLAASARLPLLCDSTSDSLTRVSSRLIAERSTGVRAEESPRPRAPRPAARSSLCAALLSQHGFGERGATSARLRHRAPHLPAARAAATYLPPLAARSSGWRTAPADMRADAPLTTRISGAFCLSSATVRQPRRPGTGWGRGGLRCVRVGSETRRRGMGQ